MPAAFATALRRAGESAGAATLHTSTPEADSARERKSAPATAKAKGTGTKRSASRWVLGIGVSVVLAAAAGVVFFGRVSPPPVPMLEARVRTEPAGLAVRLNGAPLSGDAVQFAAGGPFGVLAATVGSVLIPGFNQLGVEAMNLADQRLDAGQDLRGEADERSSGNDKPNNCERREDDHEQR
jgi:hypothetical protein